MPDTLAFYAAFIALGAVVAGALCAVVPAVEERQKKKRLSAIVAERIRSDEAWALAEQVFAEMKPHLSEEKQTEVLRAVFARIKKHLEDA